MHKPISIDMAHSEPVGITNTGLLTKCSFVSACALAIIGLIMLVMVLLTQAGLVLKLIEVFLSLSTIASGVLLWQAATRWQHKRQSIGLLAGEIALAVIFVYMGVAMPVFHQGLASPGAALIQFSAILAGLIVGTVALGLSGATRGARPAGKIVPAAVVRDSVILMTGTILLAIALGQLPGAVLKPPQWNWISFLGITVPGMLMLLGREAVKQWSETWQGPTRILRLLLTESLLIVGFAIMLYGSYSNLNLGANGYQVGPKGNATGLLVWLAAALFLLLIRGTFKLIFSERNKHISYHVASKLLYVLAAVVFIYGERSVLTGKAPQFVAGGAAFAAATILLGALLVLLVARPANQKVSAQ